MSKHEVIGKRVELLDQGWIELQDVMGDDLAIANAYACLAELEHYSAAGRFPGGFLKREGRPTMKETLTSRLIDRPIRPLFADGFMNEVQVVCTVMSADKTIDPDIPAMIGTSAALAISGCPFNGPIGGARVGFSEEHGYLLNPAYDQLAESKLDMVVAGTYFVTARGEDFGLVSQEVGAEWVTRNEEFARERLAETPPPGPTGPSTRGSHCTFA